jgi:hypothetical protein
MFKVVSVEGRTRVLTYCDQCHLRIEDAGLGLYTWIRAHMAYREDYALEVEPTGGALVFLHKGECHRAHEREHGWQPWHELSWFPVYMGNNVAMDWERTIESMGNLAGLSERAG